MAYVDQNQSGQKTVSAIISAIVLGAVGYAFVNGLAYDAYKKVATKLNVIDIKSPPPPPPKKPPPPPKDQPKVESPPLVVPPPIVPVQAPPTVPTVPKPPPYIPPPAAPVVPTIPPPPPKPSAAAHAKPRGNLGDLMSSDDYPPAAIRNNEQGTVAFTLNVGPDGRVTNCSVTSSSGFADLDQTACRLLIKRARFAPAKDASGNGIEDTYSSRFTWQVPKD
ncbi:energy transducer TonB [Sphingomonas sp. CGMCC 1.13654]|uniref:Protein TonB n=1 Tax=Sphingomonas chungangi TaxID=2683589 RepID=A0A838L631_9SPHN|nr:energy transducer TonB [Sphingomonas chungangi]MBA2934165.1 energy transducer TonB [Sphingomonas chungangi]MVW57206.1 TonB family protein [Sphingomonas chungangi]